MWDAEQEADWQGRRGCWVVLLRENLGEGGGIMFVSLTACSKFGTKPSRWPKSALCLGHGVSDHELKCSLFSGPIRDHAYLSLPCLFQLIRCASNS
jgi:hypothetical protein